MKKYVVRLFEGNRTFYYLVKDPVLGNGSLKATLIGKLANIDNDYVAYFFKCNDKEIMLMGTIACEETDYDPYIDEDACDTVGENVKEFFNRK